MTRIDLIELSYKLSFATPFHCGTGLRLGLIDRTVVRDREGYLYTPGSTIKGVLREHCERLARFYEEPDDEERDEKEHERATTSIASPHDGRAALLSLGPRITMITRIFGSNGHPGRLFFEDARQSEEDREQYGRNDQQDAQLDLYTQVRLNRLTRTAEDGALYSGEFGVKDLMLQGSINGWLECMPIDGRDDAPTYSLLLLLAGLQMMKRIGANKSTGKGECQCTITRLAVNDYTYTTEQWQGWLESLDALTNYSSAMIAAEGGEA